MSDERKKLKQRFRCKHCGKILLRKTDKQWVKSYCTQTGRTVHLMPAAGDSAAKGVSDE